MLSNISRKAIIQHARESNNLPIVPSHVYPNCLDALPGSYRQKAFSADISSSHGKCWDLWEGHIRKVCSTKMLDNNLGLNLQSSRLWLPPTPIAWLIWEPFEILFLIIMCFLNPSVFHERHLCKHASYTFPLISGLFILHKTFLI